MVTISIPHLHLHFIFLFCSLNQHLFQTTKSSFNPCSLNSQLLQKTPPLSSTPTSGNETDLLSLLAIKDQIQGLNSWNESSHFCQWQGITCSNQRVIELNLSSQSLAGPVSPHIGNLSYVVSITLRNNKFYGQIPQEIGQLSRLQHLDMSNNGFEGEIPGNITHCSQLEVLDFTRNRLFGNIPLALGNLSYLQYFSLAENSLVGSIPDTFGKLSSLTTFSVASNRLSGEVPQSIYNISSINSFIIADNQFTGSLPLDMGITLPNLQVLRVGINQLSGPLPESLANASKMERLGFSANNFTGEVPTNLGVLGNLYWLHVGGNNLGSGNADDLAFISSLTNLSNLRILILSNNNFGGPFPNAVANLSIQIERLRLGGNQIYGTIPEEIGNLVELNALGFEGNHLHGSIPSSIGNLQKLQGLYLGENMLTGLIPSSLANLSQLSELHISGNRLEGIIPSSFGGYQRLQSLDISQNNLNGAIPKEIFGISALSILLRLSHNSFTGSLHIDVGNLQNLAHMDVSGNMLSGEIPSTLANCLSLEELHLENNLFEGTVPQSLSSLTSVQYIDLSNNNLSGPIPTYMQRFPYLKLLNLSFNKLEGDVPTEGIFQNASAISVFGNFNLCGGIQELRLPTCQTVEDEKSIAMILAIAISGALFFLLAPSLIVICWKRKRRMEANCLESDKYRLITVSYKDLFQATGGFSPSNFVGSGSFGSVYKGTLNQDESIVAVKVFNLQREGVSKSFNAECEALRNIHHRNLVPIKTSCSSFDFEGNEFKALVFDYMPRGSLERWLHRDIDKKDAYLRKLNVPQRINIAVDVALALNYLHRECHVSIIHRDLKPSNVLLDKNMVAHVSDFGLAKLLSASRENIYENHSPSVGLNGSIGYIAPEYGMGGEASIYGDVYSYGILVLELFTGKRPTDDMWKDGVNLHNYVSNTLSNQVIHILDPILLWEECKAPGDTEKIKDQVLDCVTAVLRIGVACSVEFPAERMEMGDVISELNLIRDKYFW